MGTEENISFTNNKPNAPIRIHQPSQSQWQKPQAVDHIKQEGSAKKVQFAREPAVKHDHFTKPNNMSGGPPSNNQGSRMHNSQSMPEFLSPRNKNIIPNRAPSGSGFRQSYLPSEVPSSAREEQRYIKQPASYPSGYSDKSQLGASAARITELINKSSEKNLDNYANAINDCKSKINNFIISESTRNRVTKLITWQIKV
jgi:hypothetical protein